MRCVSLIAVLLWSAQAWACLKDTDCKGDRICVVAAGQTVGACRTPQSSITQVESKPAAVVKPPAPTLAPTGDSSFHVNVLGLLQFGLAPTLEWGQDSTVLLRARLMNLGALSYLISDADGEEFVSGLGLSAQWRKYFGVGTQNGPFFGGGVEAMYTKTEGSDIYETTYVVPQFEAGNRWHDGESFSGVGAFVGLAVPIKTVGYEEGEQYITGGFSWDIGWTL